MPDPPVSPSSLHDMAPRLAEARDIERWTIWCAGEDSWLGIKDGDKWSEIIGDPEHEVGHCRGCGGAVDRYRFRFRILHGPNRGHVVHMQTGKCRRGGSGCEWWSKG